MKIDILTLFPDTVNAVLHESIIGRAAAKGIVDINCIQIRDYTDNKQNQVDDYPYGGGWGCVMMAQPLKSCLDSVMTENDRSRSRVIYMSPQGAVYNQETAKRLSREYDHIVLVCGHYEGVDERFIEQCVDEELSLGDFVLTGGEIAAMAVADSVCRLIPGVLSDEECYTGESHWDGLLEYPQYTRPEVWEGREVPGVLLEGNHAKIEQWRRMQQLERTMIKRPDMFEKLQFSDKKDRELLEKMKRHASREKLTLPVSCRSATMDDIPAIMLMVEDARALLRSHRVDQWQGKYPEAKNFETDIERGECYIVMHGDEPAAMFTISCAPEKSYEDITDGKWYSDEPYCTLHRIALRDKYRGTGISKKVISFVEELTLANGRRNLRVDTHRKNKAMQRLLRECGFRYRGNIQVFVEPGQDTARQGYDKYIKNKL